MRISPKCGATYTLLRTVLGGQILGPYKLVVIAAPVPPLPTGVTLTSDMCGHLQVKLRKSI